MVMSLHMSWCIIADDLHNVLTPATHIRYHWYCHLKSTSPMPRSKTSPAKTAPQTTRLSSLPACTDEVPGGDCATAAGPSEDDGVFDEAMQMLQKMSLDDIASAQQELAQVWWTREMS